MKKWLSIFLVSSVCMLFGQTSKVDKNLTEFQDFTAYYLFNVGYTYQNIHYFEGGLNMYLVQPNNNVLDLGATVNLGYSDSKFIAIPEAQVGYLFNVKNSAIDPYSSNFNAAFWVVRTSVSPWHVTPEVGISIVDLIDITAGYGFEFNENEHVDLDGFKAGISFRLPFLLFWND